MERVSNTVGDVFDELVVGLEDLYPIQEATSIVQVLFKEKLGMDRATLVVKKGSLIEAKQKAILLKVAEKLLEGQPVQQLIGSSWFLDLKLRINKNVLIPRPETEELVSWAIKENNHEGGQHILDVGTGSGCIAIAMGKMLEGASVTALDINQSALELAQINAISNNVDVNFINLDILKEDNWKKLKEYDIIISNPPYIPLKEKSTMHANVLEHEPHSALFVTDENPLQFYLCIAQMAKKHLCKNGKLYFEIHHQGANKIKKMLIEKGYSDVVVRQDLSGKDRMIRAIRD